MPPPTPRPRSNPRACRDPLGRGRRPRGHPALHGRARGAGARAADPESTQLHREPLESPRVADAAARTGRRGAAAATTVRGPPRAPAVRRHRAPVPVRAAAAARGRCAGAPHPARGPTPRLGAREPEPPPGGDRRRGLLALRRRRRRPQRRAHRQGGSRLAAVRRDRRGAAGRRGGRGVRLQPGTRGRRGGTPSGNGCDDPSASAGGARLAVTEALDFDPLGDGSENSGEVERVVDGDPASGWQTITYYNNPALGGLKPGVGVLLDLGRDRGPGRSPSSSADSRPTSRCTPPPKGSPSPRTSSTS